MDLGPKRVSRMCMVSCMPSLYIGFVPLAMGCVSGGPHVNKQGSALVHMHLIKLFAKDTILRQCKPYNMSFSQRDQ